VPTMLVHGDFTPWNMRHNLKVGYVLVDWEWADFAGLPAYDLLHFQFSDDRLFSQETEAMRPFEQSPSARNTSAGWISMRNCYRSSLSRICSIDLNLTAGSATTSSPLTLCVSSPPSPNRVSLGVDFHQSRAIDFDRNLLKSRLRQLMRLCW